MVGKLIIVLQEALDMLLAPFLILDKLDLQGIMSKLSEHRVSLPQTFGSYQFSRWSADPPTKW